MEAVIVFVLMGFALMIWFWFIVHSLIDLRETTREFMELMEKMNSNALRLEEAFSVVGADLKQKRHEIEAAEEKLFLLSTGGIEHGGEG